MMLHGWKHSFQTKLQHMLGVSSSVERLEQRVQDLEFGLQCVQEYLVRSELEKHSIFAYGEIDQYEEEMARLEQIFSNNRDCYMSFKWYGTISESTEHLKISDQFLTNGK